MKKYCFSFLMLFLVGFSYGQVLINETYRDITLPRIEADPSHYDFVYPVEKDFYDSTFFTPPVNGRFFVQNYGPRYIGNYDNHQGSDIWGYTIQNGVLSSNPPALCICDGTVQYISDDTDSLIELTTSGRTIRVECDSSSLVFNSPIHFYYRHLDSINNLTLGMSVNKGDVLGFVGETGTTTLSHLHFDYSGIPNQWGNSTDRKYLNPMRFFDPEKYPQVIGKLDNAHIEILRDWSDSTLIRIHWPHNQHINRFEFTNGTYNIVYDVEEVRASYAVYEPSIWAVDGMKIFPYRTNGYRTALYYQNLNDYPAIFPSSAHRDTNLLMYGYTHIPLTADSVVNIYDFMLEDVPSAHKLEDWQVKLTDVWGYTVEGKFEMETDTTVIDTTTNISIDVLETAKTFSIYPNPANDRLFIAFDELTETKTIKIYDINANLLINTEVTENNHKIDISELATGIYILSVDGESVKFCKR